MAIFSSVLPLVSPISRSKVVSVRPAVGQPVPPEMSTTVDVPAAAQQLHKFQRLRSTVRSTTVYRDVLLSWARNAGGRLVSLSIGEAASLSQRARAAALNGASSCWQYGLRQSRFLSATLKSVRFPTLGVYAGRVAVLPWRAVRNAAPVVVSAAQRLSRSSSLVQVNVNLNITLALQAAPQVMPLFYPSRLHSLTPCLPPSAMQYDIVVIAYVQNDRFEPATYHWSVVLRPQAGPGGGGDWTRCHKYDIQGMTGFYKYVANEEYNLLDDPRPRNEVLVGEIARDKVSGLAEVFARTKVKVNEPDDPSWNCQGWVMDALQNASAQGLTFNENYNSFAIQLYIMKDDLGFFLSL